MSHEAFIRLCELGQAEALQKIDGGAHWPLSAGPQELSLNRCGALIRRDDKKLVQVVEELRGAAKGYAAELRVVKILDDVKWVIGKIDGVERVSEVHRIGE
ncbi:MAG TPA: hypothetical protein PKD12_16290 [Nitrospira sp.]|nr:hypothetical protein [Nitrospira sp.]